jgi:hypothetical protein
VWSLVALLLSVRDDRPGVEAISLMKKTGRFSDMRQVRLVTCILVLGAVLSFTPLGSAQTPTFATIDPAGAGNVWAGGITSSAAISCDANHEGQLADQQGQARQQQGQVQQQQEDQCDDAAGGAPPGAAAMEVVGYYSLGVISPGNSYRWNGTTYTPLAVPGALATYASGINGAGHVVGSYSDALGTHGFLMVGTAITTIDAPGAASTFATGINTSDQIVGHYYDWGFTPHGFVYSGGVFTPVDFPGVTLGTFPTGINSLGQTVGYYYSLTGLYQGWVRTGTSMVQVSITGALEAKVNGINASGEVVGEFRDAAGWHGFRLASGLLTVVNVPGAGYTAVNGINDRGEISGEYKPVLSPRQLGFKMP